MPKLTKKVYFLIYSSLFVLLIVATVLLSLSVSITQVDEVSLTRHTRTQEVYFDADFAKPGRHFTGLVKELIPFKRKWILVDFANDSLSPNSTIESTEVTSGGNTLACWTKDGTNVYVELSYYIQLQPEKLLDFYLEFGDNWLDFIVRASYSIVKETTIDYTTEQFFTSRNQIAYQISTSLTAAFNKLYFGAIKLNDLQLRNIEFDDKFEEATVQKLIQVQKKRSYVNNKEVRKIQKEAERDIALISYQINEVIARGKGTAMKAKETTVSTSFLNLIKSFNTAYSKLKNDLAITDNIELKKHIYAMELELIQNYDSVSFVDPKQQKIIEVNKL